MEFDEFNREFAAAYWRLVRGELTDVESVQERLRTFVPTLPTEYDREAAASLVAQLPDLVARDPNQSPEMIEALRVLNTTDFETGTTAERLAAYENARKQIWAIADRAGADSLRISGLTRGLESTERDLLEGLPWGEQPGDQPRTEG